MIVEHLFVDSLVEPPVVGALVQHGLLFYLNLRVHGRMNELMDITEIPARLEQERPSVQIQFQMHASPHSVVVNMQGTGFVSCSW